MGNLAKIFVAENRFEADLISEALQREEIPVMVRGFSDTAYDGLYIPQKGWAAIMVPEEYKAQGEKVVAEFKDVFKRSREAGKRKKG